MNRNIGEKILTANVIVGALGYFVDIYDLLLFSIVRVSSLKSLGVPEELLLEKGVFLINSQMVGLLVGGLLWGIIGDKKGRVSVLFGSILLYSVANILNAFVTSVEQYGILRFVAGIGLAGELGAAITLVSETLSKENRGYGTSIVAGIGILGAVFAAFIGDRFSWQTAYLIGGGLGLALLGLRVSMFESSLFSNMHSDVRRGDLRMLFYPFDRFKRYLACVLIGIPIWFVVGILMTFSPELAKVLDVQGDIHAGLAIGYGYAGLSLGDIISGFYSQWMKSRKKGVASFLVLTAFLVVVYLFSSQLQVWQFYGLCALLGFGSGYWAVFVTIAAEQFGTNLRSTVATTVPNIVRGTVVLLTSAFQFLKPSFGLQMSALLVGGTSLFFAGIALIGLKETYGKDLNYFEK